MKKLFLFFALLAGIAVMTSCQKDQDVVTLKAVIEQDTKAYFGDNDHLPYWDGSDRVNVNGSEYALDQQSINTTFATISGVTANANNVYCAVFPKSACEKMGTPNASGTPVTIYYEPEQNYTTGTNGKQRLEMPMGAVTTNNTLIFKNLSSILRINVTNSVGSTINVKRLTVQAFGVYLAGSGTVTLRETYTTDNPLEVTMDKPHNRLTDNNVITLCNRSNYTEGMKDITSGDDEYFDIVVPPFEDAYYLIIEAEYTNSAGEWYYTSDTVRTAGYLEDEVTIDESSSITVERNKIITTSITATSRNRITANYGYLLPGPDFNDVMEDLFADPTVIQIFFNCYETNNLPPESWTQEQIDASTEWNGYKIVSTDYSPLKIYAYVDYHNGVKTVLINSRAPLLYANKDCSHMFEDLESLKGINWNTSATGGFQSEDVTDMSFMFAGCENLGNLDGSDITSLNTTNVTTMAHMFEGCSKANNIILNTWNTHNLKEDGMVAMFKGCSVLQMVDISSFTTKYITDMSELFYGCRKMQTIYMDKSDISSGTVIDDMFGGDDEVGYFSDFYSYAGCCTIRCKSEVQNTLTTNASTASLNLNKIAWTRPTPTSK